MKVNSSFLRVAIWDIRLDRLDFRIWALHQKKTVSGLLSLFGFGASSNRFSDNRNFSLLATVIIGLVAGVVFICLWSVWNTGAELVKRV